MSAPYTANLSTPEPAADWRSQAKCGSLPVDVSERLFFPGKGGLVQANEARQFCTGAVDGRPCPVREACEAAAVDLKLFTSETGIWGGRTPTDRHLIRLGRAPQPLPSPGSASALLNTCNVCGTTVTYPRQRCDACCTSHKPSGLTREEQHELRFGHRPEPSSSPARGNRCKRCDRNRARRHKGLPVDVPLKIGRPRKEQAA